MQEKNKKIVYKKDDILKVLKDINYILCSLHKMGSYYADKNKRDYEEETTRTILEKTG